MCLLFFRREPRVIGTFILDKQLSSETVVSSMAERELSPTEKELYTLRKLTETAMHTDTIFSYYSNVEYHLIPLIAGNKTGVHADQTKGWRYYDAGK
ncbi:hypothetical protein [Chitinophaga pinensis]|uniref:Uncharacterized protein n=1 Tax=Chitinophaga pinensis TaxID=79329 RepID=A0A5C6LI77_9BACT|nr:hypothetical protein [Chitinophaga pinensis]TWV91112.1 hypothetical protein FEF09_29015 [Chitinophaga pinensis]